MGEANKLVWSVYCSDYAKKNNMSYKEALVEARDSYYLDNGKEVPAIKRRAKKEKQAKEAGEPKKKRVYKKKVVKTDDVENAVKPKIIMQPKAPAKKARKVVAKDEITDEDEPDAFDEEVTVEEEPKGVSASEVKKPKVTRKRKATK